MMDSRTGRRMNRREHIRQSINDILSTSLGSRVMRRDYGSLLPELIDQPLNGATLLRAYAASATAIIRHEPRVQVQRIQLSVEKQFLTLDIETVENGVTGNMQVPLTLKGAVA